VEGTVREVKRRVRVVASSFRAIDRSVTRWIVVTMVEWSSEVFRMETLSSYIKSRWQRSRSRSGSGHKSKNNVHVCCSPSFKGNLVCTVVVIKLPCARW